MTVDLDGWSVGLIGLGLMGVPIARNLHRAGAAVTVTSRSRAPVTALVEEGMRSAASPQDLVNSLPAGAAIFVVVTDTAAVRQVITGENGVLQGDVTDKTVVDMGTTQVMDTRELAGLVSEQGGNYVDAPVSGGQVGAEQGTLSIMAGGRGEVVSRLDPLFSVLGQRVTHVGDVGAGQIAKSANQMIVGMTLDAVAEALTLAESAGADPARVRDALTGGFADSRILDLHGQRMIEQSFEPGGRVTVQRKDVIQALDLAEHVGISLPGLAENKLLWDEMVERGWGDLDHSAIVKLIKGLKSE